MDDFEPTQLTQPTQPATERAQESASQSGNVFLRLIMTKMADGVPEVINLTKDIHNGVWRFGRHRSCEVVLKGPRISNFHFEIYQSHSSSDKDAEQTVFLHDHSSNGTFINLERLPRNGRSILFSGDEIRVGLGIPRDEIRFLVQFPVNRRFPHKQQQILRSKKHRYEVIKTLGTGSFAVVKLAVEMSSGNYVAIKILNKRKLMAAGSHKKVTEMFKREIEILMSIKHPGVVRCLEVFENNEELNIVMEYVEGGDLMDFLMANGSIDEEASKPLVKQLLSTLIYLHEHGITHRDIKPENVLITKDFDLKISDFGLAKAVQNHDTFLKTFCGTMGYLAPEVLRAKHHESNENAYDEKVDVWSLGCLIYVMLSASIPFTADTQEEAVNLILTGQFPMEPLREMEISDEAIDLISKMLRVDPKERISEKEALLHPWLVLDDYERPSSPELDSQTEAAFTSEPIEQK